MSRESNKAIIFSLCVVLFAGCKSEQSETPTSTPQPSANSAPIVAINNAPVTGPPTQPAQPAGTSPSLPLGVPPPRPSGLPSPQDVVPVKPTAQPGARSAQDPVEVTNVESQFGIGTLQGWQVL